VGSQSLACHSLAGATGQLSRQESLKFSNRCQASSYASGVGRPRTQARPIRPTRARARQPIGCRSLKIPSPRHAAPVVAPQAMPEVRRPDARRGPRASRRRAGQDGDALVLRALRPEALRRQARAPVRAGGHLWDSKTPEPLASSVRRVAPGGDPGGRPSSPLALTEQMVAPVVAPGGPNEAAGCRGVGKTLPAVFCLLDVPRCSHSIPTHALGVSAPVNESPAFSRAFSKWAELVSAQTIGLSFPPSRSTSPDFAPAPSPALIPHVARCCAASR
jgi:hypothetical protein